MLNKSTDMPCKTISFNKIRKESEYLYHLALILIHLIYNPALS